MDDVLIRNRRNNRIERGKGLLRDVDSVSTDVPGSKRISGRYKNWCFVKDLEGLDRYDLWYKDGNTVPLSMIRISHLRNIMAYMRKTARAQALRLATAIYEKTEGNTTLAEDVFIERLMSGRFELVEVYPQYTHVEDEFLRRAKERRRG